MIIRVEDPTRVTLLDPEIFTAFHVSAPDLEVERVCEILGGPLHEDARHVWVPIARLHALGADAGRPDWRKGCDGMIAYAAGKGWVDEARGLVRAHLED